jgi:hypothetical protein
VLVAVNDAVIHERGADLSVLRIGLQSLAQLFGFAQVLPFKPKKGRRNGKAERSIQSTEHRPAPDADARGQGGREARLQLGVASSA